MADTIIALVAATAPLLLLPGPIVALIVITSLAHGRGHGLSSVAGLPGEVDRSRSNT